MINNFTGYGISITTTGNTIVSSYIGTNAAGTAAGGQPMGEGIVATGAGNTIGGSVAGAGNVISGNAGDGVELNGSSNVVEGNLIGTDYTGEAAVGNTLDGIRLTNSTGNTIGGTTSASRNVIAAEGLRGIEFDGASSNLVEGNYIGTDATGTVAMGDVHNGIIDQGASNTFQNNVIDASGNIGLVIDGNSTIVEGNLIGLDAAGTAAIGNTGGGIVITASGNTIGGTTAAAHNIISGNIGSSTGSGIIIGSGTGDNLIEGNFIGTNSAGTAPVPNANSGIDVQGSTGNTIGGATTTTGTGPGNVISGNTGSGISMEYSAASNMVVGNIIGLDLTGTVAVGNGSSNGGDGVTVNAGGNTIGGTSIWTGTSFPPISFAASRLAGPPI